MTSQPHSADSKGYNVRAYGPLRKIVDHAEVGGRLAYEVLECGHRGEGQALAGQTVERVHANWVEAIELGCKVKTARRCRACGIAAGITESDWTKA